MIFTLKHFSHPLALPTGASCGPEACRRRFCRAAASGSSVGGSPPPHQPPNRPSFRPPVCAVLLTINVLFHLVRLALGISLEQAMDAHWVIRPAVSRSMSRRAARGGKASAAAANKLPGCACAAAAARPKAVLDAPRAHCMSVLRRTAPSEFWESRASHPRRTFIDNKETPMHGCLAGYAPAGGHPEVLGAVGPVQHPRLELQVPPPGPPCAADPVRAAFARMSCPCSSSTGLGLGCARGACCIGNVVATSEF